MPPTCKIARALDVQVLHIERIVFDKLATSFNVFAHQGCEDGFRLGNIFQLDLKQRAAFRIHGGFPQLRGGHFAQAFVALDRVLLLALFDDVCEEFAGRLLFDRLAQRTGRAAGRLGFSQDFSAARRWSTLCIGFFGIFRGGLCAGGLRCILDEEGRLEEFFDQGVLGHHLAELGAGSQGPVNAPRGALRIGEADGPGVVLLVFQRLAHLELELLGQLGKLGVQEGQLGRNIASRLRREICAVQ